MIHVACLQLFWSDGWGRGCCRSRHDNCLSPRCVTLQYKLLKRRSLSKVLSFCLQMFACISDYDNLCHWTIQCHWCQRSRGFRVVVFAVHNRTNTNPAFKQSQQIHTVQSITSAWNSALFRLRSHLEAHWVRMWQRNHRMSATSPLKSDNNTRQQDFGTWKVYCVCNVTFHAEFKYAITIFPSSTVFVQWHFLLSIFRNFRYILQRFFHTWTNILNGFEQRVVTDDLPLSNH